MHSDMHTDIHIHTNNTSPYLIDTPCTHTTRTHYPTLALTWRRLGCRTTTYLCCASGRRRSAGPSAWPPLPTDASSTTANRTSSCQEEWPVAAAALANGKNSPSSLPPYYAVALPVTRWCEVARWRGGLWYIVWHAMPGHIEHIVVVWFVVVVCGGVMACFVVFLLACGGEWFLCNHLFIEINLRNIYQS